VPTGDARRVTTEIHDNAGRPHTLLLSFETLNVEVEDEAHIHTAVGVIYEGGTSPPGNLSRPFERTLAQVE